MAKVCPSPSDVASAITGQQGSRHQQNSGGGGRCRDEVAGGRQRDRSGTYSHPQSQRSDYVRGGFQNRAPAMLRRFGYKRKLSDPHSGNQPRRKMEKIILPRHFLHGGNINDPLNLNSLPQEGEVPTDHAGSSGCRLDTPLEVDEPSSSSKDLNEPVEVIIPMFRRDPLNLAERKNKKKRKRRASLRLTSIDVDMDMVSDADKDSALITPTEGWASDSELGRAPQEHFVVGEHSSVAGTLMTAKRGAYSGRARKQQKHQKVTIVSPIGFTDAKKGDFASLMRKRALSAQPLLPGNVAASRLTAAEVTGARRPETLPRSLKSSVDQHHPSNVGKRGRHRKRNQRKSNSRSRSRSLSTSSIGSVEPSASAAVLPVKDAEAKPKPPPKFNEKLAKFRYGNYNKYYGYRLPDKMSDPRLHCIKTDWITDKEVLDIGCNIGHVTLTIAKDLHPRKILGIDIDQNLIGIARKNIRNYLDAHNEAQQLPPGPSGSGQGDVRFPAMFTRKYGPLSALPVQAKPGIFPYNVIFKQGNYVLESDALLSTVQPEYDTIIALSVTKWIHLNWGDDGIKRFFKRVFLNLRPGGIFLMEPQPLVSYKKKKNLALELYNNFQNMKFRPDQFNEYLLSKEVGFSTCQSIGVAPVASKGFSRPMYLFQKLAMSRMLSSVALNVLEEYHVKIDDSHVQVEESSMKLEQCHVKLEEAHANLEESHVKLEQSTLTVESE